MKIEYGEMISFVMAAASTILTVIPLMMIPSTDDNTVLSHIQIHEAENVKNNNNSSYADKLWAYNKLQTPDKGLSKINTTQIDYYNNKFMDLKNNIDKVSTDSGSLLKVSMDTKSLLKEINNDIFSSQYYKDIQPTLSDINETLNSTKNPSNPDGSKISIVKKDVDNLIFANNNKNLAVSTLYYNNGDIQNAIKYFNHTQPNIDTILDKNSWYKLRVLSIEAHPFATGTGLKNNSTIKSTINSNIEDIYCVDDKLKFYHNISEGNCSHSELMNLTHMIHGLSQSGNTSDFYNTEFNILGLQKPEDNFINYLNYFIIGSLISGPVIFLITAKWIGNA
jgi:hypothetical protein